MKKNFADTAEIYRTYLRDKCKFIIINCIIIGLLSLMTSPPGIPRSDVVSFIESLKNISSYKNSFILIPI